MIVIVNFINGNDDTNDGYLLCICSVGFPTSLLICTIIGQEQ